MGLATLSLTLACGETHTRPVAEPPIYQDSPGLDGAPDGIGLQPWGAGATWYDYDGTTHMVTPANRAWYVVRGDKVWHLTITRYYDAFGTSGHPDMRVHRWNATTQSWTLVGTWAASEKVSQNQQCFSLDAPTQPRGGSACETFDYDVLWRADFRPIPEAGFAISNPAFYIATDKGGEVFRVEDRHLPTDLSVLETNQATRIYSIFDHDAVSIIQPHFFNAEGTEGNTIISLTGDMFAAQWRVDDVDGTLRVESRCAAITATSYADAPTLTGATQAITFAVDDLPRWTLIDLCTVTGPAIAYERDTLRPGAWPSNATFDLAIERTATGYTLWMTPEQVVVPQRDRGWVDVVAPLAFWSN